MKKLQLLLTNPCTKQWEELQPAGATRYCDQCEKNIIDLTTKSDAELIRFFTHKQHNVCGRLLGSQLNRDLIKPSSKPNWQWLVPFAVGTMIVSSATGQDLKPIVVQQDQTEKPTAPKHDVEVVAPVINVLINGKILDASTNKPLSGVKITQKDFSNVLGITDSAGNFSLRLGEIDRSTLFSFRLPGYVFIDTLLSDDMVLKMSADQVIRMGGISSVSSGHSPLYIVDAGDKSCTIDRAKMAELPQEWIANINIMKAEEGMAIYGSKAAFGVIVIKILDKFASQIDFSKGVPHRSPDF